VDFDTLRDTFIEDERWAPARLLELGTTAGTKESVRATGAVSCNAPCAARAPTSPFKNLMRAKPHVAG